VQGALGHDAAPRLLAAGDGLGKKVVQQEVGQVRVLFEGVADVAEEAAGFVGEKEGMPK